MGSTSGRTSGVISLELKVTPSKSEYGDPRSTSWLFSQTAIARGLTPTSTKANVPQHSGRS